MRNLSIIITVIMILLIGIASGVALTDEATMQAQEKINTLQKNCITIEGINSLNKEETEKPWQPR